MRTGIQLEGRESRSAGEEREVDDGCNRWALDIKVFSKRATETKSKANY